MMEQVVFLDTTTALAPITSGGGGGAGGGGGGGGAGAGAACHKRLIKEYRRLLKCPPPGIEAHPLEANILSVC